MDTQIINLMTATIIRLLKMAVYQFLFFCGIMTQGRIYTVALILASSIYLQDINKLDFGRFIVALASCRWEHRLAESFFTLTRGSGFSRE